MAQRMNNTTGRGSAANSNRTKNSSSKAANAHRSYYQDTYIDGNTVRKVDIRRKIEEEPRKKLSNTTRKNREKANHMSLGYVMFLMGALCCSGLVLINYIQLQSDITTKVETIAKLERDINNLKLSNDENYNRIVNGVDLEEIKRIAIGELGMTYAKEGQIENYTNEGNDYLRQVVEDY